MSRGRNAPLSILICAAMAAWSAETALAQGDPAAAADALRAGRYEDAQELYEALVDRGVGGVDAVRGFVRSLTAVGRYEEAERVARRHASSEGFGSEIQNTLGEVLVQRGKRDEARRAFRAALEAGATDALRTRLNLATLAYERGEREAARSEFDRFIDIYNRRRDLSSDDLSAIATAVSYLGVDDPQLYKDALRAYEEAIAADPGNLEPRVRIAELLLEKYVSGEAAAAFREVLEINPTHPEALLGLARQRRFDGSPDALELVGQALKMNPNLVAARVFRAELLLELERYDEAEHEAERALTVNAGSLEALGVLAGAAYLRGDTARFEEIRRRIEALNPRYAQLYVTLARLAERNRLYFEAVRFAERAVDLDTREWRGMAVLGINQLRIGLIEEGRSTLEAAFRGDPYDIWTKNTLDLLDTFEAYRQVRTPRFVFVIDGKESDLLSLYISDLAEEAYERLEGVYGYSPRTPIRVEVFRSHADFSVRTVGLVGLGALGVSFGPVIALDSPSAREAGEFNWGSTFWHELAHTFHLGSTDHRVPRWLSEGLAVYEETQARPGWGRGLTPGFLVVLREGQLLPISKLNEGFVRPRYPEQISHSYYQASLVCEFIVDRAGRHALVDMLDGYGDGLSTDQVLTRVLGDGADEFDRRFLEYLENRFAGPLASLESAAPTGHGERRDPGDIERRARENRDDFFAQLAYGRQLFQQGRFAEAEAFLERARALFPQYGGPENPYWYLAAIEKGRGDLEAAESLLESLTSLNDQDYRAVLELAGIRESLGDTEGAAAALDRAMYIYPYDLEVHGRLADLYERLGRWEAAVRERRAVLALDPVDRAGALFRLARAHLEAGDLGSARRAILRALEIAPSFEPAQELLLELRARSSGGTTGGSER